MPGPDTDHVTALVSRLTPLASVARGDLIRAQDWNVLVGALIDVAQSLLATASSVVPPHEHPGQVKLDWLDPNLTTLVERGPLGDPDQVGRLQGTERELTALRADLDRVAGDLNQMRLRWSDLAGRDLTRESQVGGLAVKLETAAATRDDVAALRGSFAAAQESMAAAIAVGQQLTVDGQPVNMADVIGRLSGLEGFRDGLKTADGTLIDAAAIDRQITAKTNGLVTRDDVNAILDQRPVTIPDDQRQAIADAVRASVSADVNTTMSQLGDAIRAQTDQRLAGIDAIVARAVSDAVPALRDGILATVRNETAATVQAAVTQMQGTFERRLGETQAALQQQFAQQLSDASTQITGGLRNEFQRGIAASVTPLQQRVDALDGQMRQTNVRFARQDETIGNLGDRVNRLRVAPP